MRIAEVHLIGGGVEQFGVADDYDLPARADDGWIVIRKVDGTACFLSEKMVQLINVYDEIKS